MICKVCGSKVEEGEKFCPNCGSELEEKVEVVEVKEEEKPAKVWKVFAKVSKIVGIVAIATSICGISWCTFSIIGVVFGILAGKAKDEEADEMRSLGIKLSVAGAIISFVLYIVYVILAFVFSVPFFENLINQSGGGLQ